MLKLNLCPGLRPCKNATADRDSLQRRRRGAVGVGHLTEFPRKFALFPSPSAVREVSPCLTCRPPHTSVCSAVLQDKACRFRHCSPLTGLQCVSSDHRSDCARRSSQELGPCCCRLVPLSSTRVWHRKVLIRRDEGLLRRKVLIPLSPLVENPSSFVESARSPASHPQQLVRERPPCLRGKESRS